MEGAVPHGSSSEAAATTNDGAVCSITAKQWDTVAVWSWNVQVGTCAICKSAIADRCIECCGMGESLRNSNTATTAQGNSSNWGDRSACNQLTSSAGSRQEYPAQQPQQELTMASAALAWGGDVAGECLIVWGVCNHVFHLHCISRWLRQHLQCPICGREWEVAKTTRNDY
ncbi:RING box protein [Trypanosoma rangeli]|uniref:RING box protein n=1 Tax=Trypanosoma rangeli TaxID=5698 RepID=A0A422MVY9_TRYRA|nr:RING box protein [Trypanosoma rangeli]RNE97402.1 RING box protein [Trypanosoma rangeli]|eukprot:RNE97402.1 RING box protein [Trypanosoma rangeli]